MQNVFIPAHFTSYRILKRKHSRVFQQSFNNSKAKIFSYNLWLLDATRPTRYQNLQIRQAVDKCDSDLMIRSEL